MNAKHDPEGRDHLAQALDEALELTFPASDPIAVAAATESDKVSDTELRQAGWQ